VIHQENQGLAEVRNVGLREAKGEWIQFVDSDDWIEPETIETCYNLALKHDAEIVCFQCVLEYEGSEYGKRKANHGDNRSYTDKIMSGEEGFSVVMLPGYIDVFSWNKLAKKSLYDGIEYPRGKIGEDLPTTYKIIIKARTVLYTAREFYHYLQRSSSLIHTYKPDQLYNNSDSMLGYIKLANERKLNENKEYMINILSGTWFWKITVANTMIKNDVCNMEYIRKVQKEIRPFTVLKSKLSPVRKIQILLFKFSLKLYAMAYMRAKRK
jgi:glycosyltransferase involved in cell wall biosynthesis